MRVWRTCKGCENDFEQTLSPSRDISEYCGECQRERDKQREEDLQFLQDQHRESRERRMSATGTPK